MERAGKAKDRRGLGPANALAALLVGPNHPQGNPGFIGQFLLRKSVQFSQFLDGNGLGMIPGVKNLKDLGSIEAKLLALNH